MAAGFSRQGRFVYGTVLLGISVYCVTRESIRLRHVTLDGLELYVLGAAFFTGFVDFILAGMLNYDSNNEEDPYRWFHYALTAIGITLIATAFVFTFIEDEIFNLPDGL